MDWREQQPYARKQGESFDVKYTGSCYCGAVKFKASSDPVDAKFCHCTGCQSLHGAPMQWAAIFHKKDILFDEDALDNINFYDSENKQNVRHLPCKISCKQCRSPIADEGRNMMLMFPVAFKIDRRNIPHAFKPTCHIFYGQRVADIKDGMPKFEGHKDHSNKIEE
ncbi:ydiJ [Acrasis kona]|uniref:YdiJ n=1 Tax=Acrasis kona TaxID=1008807 RepID=A0AAW2YJU8_9EUKA